MSCYFQATPRRPFAGRGLGGPVSPASSEPPPYPPRKGERESSKTLFRAVVVHGGPSVGPRLATGGAHDSGKGLSLWDLYVDACRADGRLGAHRPGGEYPAGEAGGPPAAPQVTAAGEAGGRRPACAPGLHPLRH